MTALRTSPAEVRGLFRRVVAAAEIAGIDAASGWVLAERVVGPLGAPAICDQRGSLVVRLGRSNREAALVLSGMATALEMVPAKGRPAAGVGTDVCPECKGWGLERPGGPDCGVCGGSGLVRVPAKEAATDQTRCPDCRTWYGPGEDPMSTGPCPDTGRACRLAGAP